MNANNLNILLRNNTGNKGKQSLISNFVVRTKIFDDIIKEIKSSTLGNPEQHYLVIGQRGIGKTTLLYRLMYEIEDDCQLNSRLMPVMFPEEQYNLSNLQDLWVSIGEYLIDYEEFNDLCDEISQMECNAPHREEKIWECIERRLSEKHKGIVVFLENIDVFFKKIGKPGQQRLREILMTSPFIRLIGAATFHFESIKNYTDPFYSFFKVVQLEGLNQEDSKKLLLSLADELGKKEETLKILKKSSKRLESFRRLTGGNPRTISYLLRIFLDSEDGSSITDLYKLLDDLTLLYKSELDKLSPQQQKIVDVIARKWDAISTREISKSTDIESKQVAAVLKGLQRDQIVEVVSTKNKNNFYRIRDRFLNIWYLMRFGRRKDRENIIWLVRFYDTWCSRSELSQRIEKHITLLKKGQYDPNAAVDMGNVFLACENVAPEQKYNIYTVTKALLPKESSCELKLTEGTLRKTILELIKKQKVEKASSMLCHVKDDKLRFRLMALVLYAKGDYSNLVSMLEDEYRKGKNAEMAYQIAFLYSSCVFDSLKAVSYLLESANLGNTRAYYTLGQVYYYELYNWELAQQYHRQSIELGYQDSISALSKILLQEQKYEEGYSLLEIAEEKGDREAILYMAFASLKQNNVGKAIDLYNKAIERGLNEAPLMLAELYMNQKKPDYDSAQKLLLETVRFNYVKDAYYQLGKLYQIQDNSEEAIAYLEKGVQKKEASSAHLLAHVYQDKNWTLSKNLFKKAIAYGDFSSVICLSDIAFVKNGHNDKKAILDIYEKNKHRIFNDMLVTIEYCKILIWNERVSEALSVIVMSLKQLLYTLEKSTDEESVMDIIEELITCFVLLIAKGYYKDIEDLFDAENGRLKQHLKPVYYVLMYYLQKKYPDEYLKAGNELKETIEELIKKVESFRQKY